MLWRRKRDPVVVNALDSINRSYQSLSNLGMDFPDLNVIEYEIKKNQFTVIPPPYSNGVINMGLILKGGYVSCLVRYAPGGEIKPHKHKDHYEAIVVLEGSIYNKTSKKRYKKGDICFIDKAEPHHIIEDEDLETYLFIIFSYDRKDIDTFIRNYPNRLKEINAITL